MATDSFKDISPQPKIKEFEAFRKINSPDGWITPTGSFYGCGPNDHDLCAEYLLKTHEVFINTQLEENFKSQMAGNFDEFPKREVLKAAGFALLSDNWLADSNLPEKLSIRQLEIIKRSGFPLPKRDGEIDPDIYLEFKEIILKAIEDEKQNAKRYSHYKEGGSPIDLLKKLLESSETSVHEEDRQGSVKEAFDLITKDSVAEQTIELGKGVITLRLMKLPSGKDIVVRLDFHDHSEQGTWDCSPVEETWLCFKSKESVNEYISKEVLSGRHGNWHLSGSLDTTKV